MARPQKEGLDYFPLDVDMDQDDKIALIEARYGIVGFGVVIRLLMKIYKNSYFYEWTEKEQLLFSRRVHVDINVINEIINDCLKWGIFDKSMHEKHKVLTSRGIQRRYLKAVDRRQSVQISSTYMLLDGEEVNAYKNLVIVDENCHSSSNNANINPQSKVKKSKEKNSREENTITTSTDADYHQGEKELQADESLPVDHSKNLTEKRFDEFWAAYPKKVGKKAAWSAWNKIKPDTELYDRIMAAIGRARATDQWQRENGRFIPNPATWLNQGRWDDEYEEASTNGEYRSDTRTNNKEPTGTKPWIPGTAAPGFKLAGFKPAWDEDDEDEEAVDVSGSIDRRGQRFEKSLQKEASIHKVPEYETDEKTEHDPLTGFKRA